MNIMQKLPTLTTKQKRIALLSCGSLLLLLLIGLGVGLSVRGKMLDRAMVKVERTLLEKYQVNFRVRDYRFTGLATVTFDDIQVIPKDRDTLAQIKSMAVSVRLWPLLFGDVKIGNLALNDSYVTLVKRDSVSNYDFLFKKRPQDSIANEKKGEQNYAALLDGLIRQVFFKIPRDMDLDNFELSYTDDSVQQRVRLPKAVIDAGDFEASLFLNDHDAQWNLAGYVNSDRQQLRVEVSSEQKNVELPFLRGKFGLGVSFDKIMFNLDRVKRESQDSLTLAGKWAFENLKVQHRRLSLEPILLPEAAGEGQINIGKLAVEVDPSSTIRVKEFVFQPQVRFVTKPNKTLRLAIHTGTFEAQKLFDAMPTGLFETVDGIQVSGKIAYDLDFSVDFDNPDALTFVSAMDDKDLKVVKWGKANVSEMNGPFVYRAFEDTVLMREIIVGPQNPKFTPLSHVSSILKKTVLNTEDPYFYEHNGFEEEAFKLSIATNIKEKAFKRGASTISMQLVKNIFLNRNKTMMRKFEEIVLVWLIEASKQVSKDRMFEVYLNVIEWGRNVYGINEASSYYFGKTPAQLTIGESLYLSSIIPRPKTGLSSFDYTGHLKPWVQRHFNTYGYIMTKRQQLNDEAVPAAYGFYDVVVQPSLRPPRPKGLVDTTFMEIDPEQEAIMKELEADEATRKSLLEKLFGKEKKEGEQ
ncbi:transglycosylase domain-containing protein [Sphingobacterium oryzagri]|uniref:Transglycosylase domain-containing protein n=1 Tax=Sphingobacterium oryzagri TaxID=3025669 RepID=A0ABY7WI46_9SPHI|nr:biosynthetic peptidoglycan transglycosylase [Sphingobacterium sp. KACC 22765]WDF69292.1 transglycosylase domain-containing protein [Sphingobacterium sp. KACC 22765]